jgi:hypothetical protein
VTVGAFWEIREYGGDVPETATRRHAPNAAASPLKGTVRPTRIWCQRPNKTYRFGRRTPWPRARDSQDPVDRCPRT